jgi:hypothetical protein
MSSSLKVAHQFTHLFEIDKISQSLNHEEHCPICDEINATKDLSSIAFSLLTFVMVSYSIITISFKNNYSFNQLSSQLATRGPPKAVSLFN